MLKKLLLFTLLACSLAGYGQECPDPLLPVPGSTGVPVDATISWEPVVGIPAYLISIGTTPGGSDIVSSTSTGSVNSFTPPFGLPENTEVFVTITLFQISQPDITCPSFSFTTAPVTEVPQQCSSLVSPAAGATNVPVSSSIRWEYSPTAIEYVLSAGTSPGGTDIADNVVISNSLTYTPPADWPPETTIYVNITPRNNIGEAVGCVEQSFTTGPIATLPTCTALINPAPNSVNNPLDTDLQWTDTPGAEGYRLFIGTSPFENDIFDGGTVPGTSINFFQLEPNTIYYVRIVPFNSAGEAQTCPQQYFATTLGCGPYFDSGGNLIDFNPEVSFPDTIGLCESDSFLVSAPDMADGYRWYAIDSPTQERLLAETPDFLIPGEGTYRYEVYNTVTGSSGSLECSNSKVFSVVTSEAPTIEGTNVSLGVGVITIRVDVSGSGDYEFALNNSAGPYQDSNRFPNLAIDSYTVYVRDKNGCGTVEAFVEPDLTLEGFPKFFTPNGDGVNDFWQFILPPSGVNPIRAIYIFDRYGNLLAQLDPASPGWDGTLNGRPMPASDYWFRAINNSNSEVRGHFSLKR